MEINSTTSFLSYFEKVRQGTNQIIQVIPYDKMNWTYKPEKFTIADIIRHIAAIERNVFAEIIQGNNPCYKGCGEEVTTDYESTLHYFDEMHKQSVAIIMSLKDDDLNKKITTLNGSKSTIGAFLRALIIHEIHHTGALCIYLNLLDIKTPPIFGLTEKQVIEQCNTLKE